MLNWYRKRKQTKEISELEQLVRDRGVSVGWWIETLDETPPHHTQAGSALDGIIHRLNSLGVSTAKLSKNIAPLVLKTRNWVDELGIDRSLDPPRHFHLTILGDWRRKISLDQEQYHDLRLLVFDASGVCISGEEENSVACLASHHSDRETDDIELAGYLLILRHLTIVTDRGRASFAEPRTNHQRTVGIF